MNADGIMCLSLFLNNASSSWLYALFYFSFIIFFWICSLAIFEVEKSHGFVTICVSLSLSLILIIV